MILGIDYDRTWSADPVLWRWFVEAAVRRGHQVILVTNRISSFPWGAEVRKATEEVPLSDVVFAGVAPKRAAAEQRGWRVDVWVDDVPETVDRGLRGVPPSVWREPGVR